MSEVFRSLTFLAVGGGQLVQIAVQEALICRRRILDVSESSLGMEWNERVEEKGCSGQEWGKWNGMGKNANNGIGKLNGMDRNGEKKEEGRNGIERDAKNGLYRNGKCNEQAWGGWNGEKG